MVKRVEPWSVYASAAGVNLDDIEDMFRKTAAQPGLVHAVSPGGQPTVCDDKYTVQLAPLGLTIPSAAPKSEAQLKMATHGLLHGLSSLHQVHSVHNHAFVYSLGIYTMQLSPRKEQM